MRLECQYNARPVRRRDDPPLARHVRDAAAQRWWPSPTQAFGRWRCCRTTERWQALQALQPAPTSTTSTTAAMHELFDAQVRAHAGRTAVARRRSGLSYARTRRTRQPLAQRAARARRATAAQRGRPVRWTAASTWSSRCSAVLKAGAAYVPLDPAFPPSAWRYMAEDAAPRRAADRSIAPAELLGDARATGAPARPRSPP